MNRWYAASAAILSLAGAGATQASAQGPYDQGYYVVQPGYDPRGAPPAPPHHRRGRDHYGYGRGYYGGSGEAVQAASLLAENATHLAEAANAAAFDRRLVIDAYDFAEQAVYFERLVASGADPRTVERDFHSLARDYERLHSNFGRYGFERQGRHLEDDFNEVRQAFYYTAETLRTAYAYSSPGRGYYARGRGAGRYALRFQLNF